MWPRLLESHTTKYCMEFAVTGHTKGIGRALFKELKKRGHIVSGFSRSNNYDISDPIKRQTLIEKIANKDVFINNAFSSPGQFELLESFINLWKDDENKMIVHIGSKGIYDQNPPVELQTYCKEKQKQHDLIRERLFYKGPKILNIIIGLVDTEMSTRISRKKIATEDLAVLIVDLIKIKDKICCQEIILDPPG